MKRQKTGILLEKNVEGIVFTAEGEFCRISPPSAEIGEEVSFSRSMIRQWWTLALAAAVLAVFIGLGMLRYIHTSPVAYVALDINPSLEFGIDKAERVIEVSLLNEDARRLAAGLSLKGRTVTEAITLVIERAEEMDYISEERSGVVLVTVVPVRSGLEAPETERLAQAAVRQLERKNVAAKVVAASVSSSLRNEARRLGISPGRYALKVGAGNDKQVMTVQELKQEGLTQLEQRRQVTVEQLLKDGHQDQVIVVPPRVQNKSRNHRKEDAGEDTVTENKPPVTENKPPAGGRIVETPPPVPAKPSEEVREEDGAAEEEEKKEKENVPPEDRMDHRREMPSRGKTEQGITGNNRREVLRRSILEEVYELPANQTFARWSQCRR